MIAISVLLAALGVLFLISIVLPVPRRMWAFTLRAWKYFGLWLLDVTRLRWIGYKLVGKEYRRLERPVLLRRFCEDMGPTFLKFGQIIASSAGLFPTATSRSSPGPRRCGRSFAQVQQILAEDRAPSGRAHRRSSLSSWRRRRSPRSTPPSSTTAPRWLSRSSGPASTSGSPPT
jgi:hypothetical protein